MKQKIAIKKLNAIVLNELASETLSENYVASLNLELMNLGYILSSEAYEQLKSCPLKKFRLLYTEVINTLKEIKGADVNYTPMYPNFPKQVMEKSELSLSLNAFVHYWTKGLWTPKYENFIREKGIELVDFKILNLVQDKNLVDAFEKITQSKDSISEEDKSILEYILKNHEIVVPENIPFKENLCYLAGLLHKEGKDISPMLQTSTDILRVITYLSDGDVSLSTNTKFKSLKRKDRRLFIKRLEEVIREEDIRRHKNKWNKLFHSLHIGEYNVPKTKDIVQKIRSNQKLESFNSKTEKLLKEKNLDELLKHLESRAGVFARQLANLLTVFSIDSDKVLKSFQNCVKEVPSRNLVQLLGSLNSRYKNINSRVIFPKGNTQRAQVIVKQLKAIDKEILDQAITLVKDTMREQFNDLEDLGKVYIDPKLKNCPLPSQQRSASEGAFNVARGTRIPLKGDKNTLRFFIYWKGKDIDLSATLHDENFCMVERVAYTNLKSEKYQACHSGDITYAPEGASEFIDITMDKARNAGLRYVVMNVLVYSGPNFSDHEICYAGWMLREKPESNEIYDPKTVEQKINVTSSSRRAIPVVFDLKNNEAIWLDLSGSGDDSYQDRNINNVENHKASIEEVLKAMVTLDNKTSLYDLFTLHAEARGTLVNSSEEADLSFGFEGDITPYNIMEINSNYLK